MLPGTTNRVLNLGAGDSTCPDETAGNANLFGCSFAPILEFSNVTKASYNGLVTSLTKQISDSRYLGRTYFTLGYTFSHAIDNVSGFRQRNSIVPSLDPDLTRASGDTDVRHRDHLQRRLGFAVRQRLGFRTQAAHRGLELISHRELEDGFPDRCGGQLTGRL